MNWGRIAIILGFIMSGLLWLDLNTRYNNRFDEIEKKLLLVEDKIIEIKG